MPKGRRKRKTYTEDQRKSVLAAAQKEGLTAAQVEKRFHVKPITYYSWRKKSHMVGRRGRRPGTMSTASLGNIGGQVRSAVQTRIRAILPTIVKSEVGNYVDSLFGGGGRRRRRIKV